MNKLTQEEVKQIYINTKTQKELAEQYNVSIPTISDIMNRKSHIKVTGGLKKPTRNKYNYEPKIPKQTVINIFKCNESVNNIAKKYNVNRTTVWRIKKGLHYSDVTSHLENKNDKYRRVDRLDVIDIYLDEREVSEISKEYNISNQTVWNIKSKRTYKEITDEIDEDFL